MSGRQSESARHSGQQQATAESAEPTRSDDVTEQKRLNDAREGGIPWKKWGPYLSDRQWGTVREDYSENGDAWNFFTHDHARSRAYRWGEDGLGGISDDKQRLCFALALWNGQDPILKERLFGLTNSEGNHGEDVKEYYFYLDSTPTHSYMKFLYKYPQAAYPYADLVETNRRRSRNEFEYELLDTGVFEQDRYFDVFVEYAKASPEDILIRITASNRGAEEALLHVLPTLWFRNDWAPWIARPAGKPMLRQIDGPADARTIAATHVWIPVNVVLIRALMNFYLYYGDSFKIECPTGSGKMMNLFEVAKEISDRLTRIFLRDGRGRRAVYGGAEKFQTDPHWRDHILFYEYFHGDNGAGLGASHQTGWTGVVAKLIQLFGLLDAGKALEGGKMAGFTGGKSEGVTTT